MKPAIPQLPAKLKNKFPVLLPFLFSLFLFVSICLNFDTSNSLADSIEKDRFFFVNSGAFVAELNLLNELVPLHEKDDGTLLPNNFFNDKLQKTLAKAPLITAECNEQLGEKITSFAKKIGEQKISAENEEEKSLQIQMLRNDILTLTELVNLAARQKLGILKYSYFVWQDFLNKTVVISSAVFLFITFVITLIAIKFGNKINKLFSIIGLEKTESLKEAEIAVRKLSENGIAEAEELNKKLAREQIVGKRKEDLLNAIPEGLTAASSGQVTFVNRAMKEWFGIDSSAIGERIENIFEKTGTNGSAGKFKSGDETYMLTVSEGQNETFYIFGNITESEELSSKLLNSERLASVGEMAARITHEIRNPLNTIKINSEYLAENIDKINLDEQKQSLSLIAGEVDRLRQITDKYMGMVSYNKSEKAEVGVALPSDLIEFLSFHLPELQKRNIELSVSQGGEMTISISLSSFKEIMLNLLKNAWEELENGGKIAVNTRKDGNFAVISVEDSGKGVPKSERETVFKNFYTKKPGGTGIGLSHSRKLATGAGGKLYVSDSTLGGAAFVLEIPVKKA